MKSFDLSSDNHSSLELIGRKLPPSKSESFAMVGLRTLLKTKAKWKHCVVGLVVGLSFLLLNAMASVAPRRGLTKASIFSLFLQIMICGKEAGPSSGFHSKYQLFLECLYKKPFSLFHTSCAKFESFLYCPDDELVFPL